MSDLLADGLVKQFPNRFGATPLAMSTAPQAALEAQFVTWRRDRLAAAGFPLPLAARVAGDPRHDIHSLLELVERGCAPDARRSGSPHLWTKGMRHDTGYAPERVHGSLGAGSARAGRVQPRRRVARMGAVAPRRGRGSGRGNRPSPRAAAAGGVVRGRSASADAAAPPRRRPRRHREPGGGRRARQRPQAAGRLPRRQPLHDLGLQVRPARGGGEAEDARLAGARGAARA